MAVWSSHECQLSNDLGDCVYCVVMLADNIIPLTVSWLSWQCQWLPWQWLQWQWLPWQWMTCAYLCLLNDHCFNQITWPQATCLSCCEGVGTLGHDVRFAFLVYFLYRARHSDVVDYFMKHLSATWSDDSGWSLLHYACRWVVCSSYWLSRPLLWARGI